MCGVGLALTSACVDDLALTETAQAASCTKLICGSNSPILGGLPFFQLDQTGVTPAPERGLRIASFSKGVLPLQVDVKGARLRGRIGPFLVLSGDLLVGATLFVEDDQGTSYRINFENRAQSQRYWEAGDDGTLLESWELTWKVLPDDGGIPRKMCPLIRGTHDGTFQTPVYHALIFGGDRYDGETGEVLATGAAAGPWFNIACAGDVLSKLLIIRHAEASQDAAHATSVAQREAAIRMFRADYCRTGPNTELGIPLDWENLGGWNTLDVAPTIYNVEAIWTADGAVCVNNPRYIAYEDIPCAVPKCTAAQIASWQSYGDFITLNP